MLKQGLRGSGIVIRLIPLLLVGLLASGCVVSTASVGPLQTESQSVELGDAEEVRVEIAMGAGELEVTGGAEELLEADFQYNVAELRPEVEYADGTLVVRQPETNGLPNLQNISDYRNEWDLRLYDEVPMDLSVDVGAGICTLQLAGLSLTGLDVRLGAGEYTIDLRGDWARDLNVSIEAGAASLTVQLPEDVGARVELEAGPHTVDAPGLTREGDFYTNAAYGASDVTLEIDLEMGIGEVNLEVGEAATAG
jgi:hypothetical protein